MKKLEFTQEKIDKILVLMLGADTFGVYKAVNGGARVPRLVSLDHDEGSRDSLSAMDDEEKVMRQLHAQIRAGKLTGEIFQELQNNFLLADSQEDETALEEAVAKAVSQTTDQTTRNLIKQYGEKHKKLSRSVVVRNENITKNILKNVKTGDGSVKMGAVHGPGIIKRLKDYCRTGGPQLAQPRPKSGARQ